MSSYDLIRIKESACEGNYNPLKEDLEHLGRAFAEEVGIAYHEPELRTDFMKMFGGFAEIAERIPAERSPYQPSK